ncbi:TipJ family phage tail tip protein [Pseudomonas asiatica]|uniref:TipJ family phage tail tip protein n=5 Tax=Pseudomonas asiatica TaxID=2219225 RepID=UPI0013749D3C|nr:DUF1983 domain-containing protein [Pseudomonas asiatica]
MGSALKIGGAKGGESKPRQPYKAPDSALSIATAKMLYIISEGEIAGPADDARSFKLDGTPLIAPDGSEAFPGTTWEFRSGSVDQEHIAGFPAAEYEQSAGLPVELRSDVAWTRAIANLDLSAVRVRLSWPQIWEVKTNGDQVGYRIDYAIELSVDGGAFNTVLSATLDDKGTTEYERSHRVDLPQGFNTAVLRVRRLTPNRNDSNFADVMRVKALTEVIDAKLRYPNLALAALQFDASQFSNIPKFSLLCRGRIIKVPNNYDPVTRTYTGSWDGTFKLAYSNNPAWVWYDLLLHRRYGLGRRITADMVDRWSLYEIGRYCDVMVPDGKGGMQPRMTTNVYIQDQVEGYALLSDLASVFRGSSCWNGSKVTVIADIPGNDDGYVFTRSNIVGEFEYGAIALPDRHTRAKISWDNPANEFKTEPTAVTNDDMIGVLGHRMLDVARFACTVEGEAIRHGIWALKSEQYETWTVRFTTGMEGRNIEPGQIIGVADELLSGRANGGRISAATARVITLDFDAQVQPEDRLIVNLPSGKAEGRIVKSVAGRQVTVMADYSELPEPESAWSIESADLGVMRFRVNTIEPKGMHQWEITGVQHEPDKFDAIDHGARVDPQPITVLPPGVIEPPESVAITSRSVVSQGIAVTTMRISWPAVKGAVAYDVEWRKDNGSWLRLPRTGTLGAEVEGIYSGVYQARVSAVSVMDVSSVFAMSALVDLKGKEGLPPAVAFLTTTPLVYGTGLAWGFPAGAEDTERTEIWQSSTTSREQAIKLGDFAYPQADHEIHGLMAGASFFYWARLIDRSGNTGPWYPDGVGINGQSSSDQSAYEEYFRDKIGNGALYPELRKEIELISGDGPGSVSDRLEAAKDELIDRIDQITDALAYDPEKEYVAGDVVRQGQRLFQAIAAVPVGAAPPNASYWADIGTILETANALALQVQQNTTDISDLDGKVTASASQLQALQAAWRDDDGEGELADAMKGWDSTARFADEVRVRATQNEATVTRLTTLDAQVAGNTAGISNLEQVVATNEQATASRLSQLKTEVDGNASHIQEVSESLSDTDQALASLRTSVESVYTAGRGDSGEGDLTGALDAWKTKAKIATEVRTLADADQALARKSDTLEASISQTAASVQQVSEAVVGVDGRVRAQTTIKAQTIVGGKKVMAGLSVGTDGDTSEILAFAQRFGVVDEVSGQLILPFVVQGGQVFINSAVINTAFIQQIVAGMTIRSAALNTQGLPLLEINFAAGTFTLRGQDANGSTLLNNGGLYVYDANGIERTAVGRMTQ